MDPIKFTVQLNQVKTLKDGGGRIVFEFGLDSLPEVQRLQKINGSGECNFAIAIIPYGADTIKHNDGWDKIEL